MKKLKELYFTAYVLLMALIVIAFAVGCILFLAGEAGYNNNLSLAGGIVAGSAIVLLGDMYIAAEFFAAAVDKGYTELKYFWIPFIITFPGYLLVGALPFRNANDRCVADDELPEL